MALLDRERGLIVLRVVYDGPPEAGKTTSLRALAGSLGQPLYSPAEENGRTLFFDWMDYTGGRFEGYQIRCQIVSVPGQPELDARRRRLLRDADVVVFVGDSTRPHLDRAIETLVKLPQLLPASVPPVGVLMQANKRDLPDAVPMTELRARMREAGLSVGVLESVAADNTGIRETFVFAVRLALDRVREQLRVTTLPVGRPEIDSGEALLARMKVADGEAAPRLASGLAAPALQQVLDENDDERLIAEMTPWRTGVAPASGGEADRPLPPDPSAPSGAIWPPVEGRLILHEASAAGMVTYRLSNGGWAAGLGSGWRTYSSADAVASDLEIGRQMLIQWARLHVGCLGVLSPNRCIVLAATGKGNWRLWQIVRAEGSLRDHLDDIRRCSTDEAASRMLGVAALLSDISARVASLPCELRCSLDTVGRGERGAMYVGLMPMERMERTAQPKPLDLIGNELESIFRSVLHDRRSEVLTAMARARRLGPAPLGGPMLEQLLGQMAAS
jgi:signal recognition particle receptor subunit beta